MNPFVRFPKTSRRLAAAAIAGCFATGPAWACAPTGGATVVNGTACFNQAGNVLTITNSNGAIINWPTFNVPQNTTTHFQQASASSSVLNRVLLNEPSVILGTLSSNGRVWLINPAGIMVGSGGRVDTAAFVASTLNITNADFLANRMKFGTDGLGGSAGNVTNQGTITTPLGGAVYLIGRNVSNDNGGIITTPKGETILAAGSTVELIDSATPGVKVEITGANGNATNLGEIVADAGRIGIAGVIVRNGGLLNASSVVEEGGRVFLRASKDAYVDGDGRIVTTGNKGGRIDVLGDRVAVMDNALLDASGEDGGGYVRVGGDYQGKNPDVPNARIAFFGPRATIKANATKVGAGGTAIVWADDTTRAYGRIEARGAGGGLGGFVETSGKRALDVLGISVDAGLGGSWLLDPADLTIVHGTDATGWVGGVPFDPASYGGSLSDTSINAAINGGSDVAIQTTGGGFSGIVFDGRVSSGGAIAIQKLVAGDSKLHVDAYGGIVFKGTTTFESFVGAGKLAVKLSAHGPAGIVSELGSVVNAQGGNAASSVEMMVDAAGAIDGIWHNFGTVNLNGHSNIILYDNGSTDVAEFRNQGTGVVNVNSAMGWSFLSGVNLYGGGGSAGQSGVVWNDGIINVNPTGGGGGNYTAWAAKYQQTEDGTLNIGVGKVLSMQNMDEIAGTVNIGSDGILRVSESHAGMQWFNGATINGGAAGTGMLDMTGQPVSFTGSTLNNATLARTGGNDLESDDFDGLTFTGNTKLFSQGNIKFFYDKNGREGQFNFPGNLTLVAGWNGTSPASSPVVVEDTGGIYIENSIVAAAGNIDVKSGSGMRVYYDGIHWMDLNTRPTLPLAFRPDSNPYGGAALLAGGTMNLSLYGNLELFNANEYEEVSGGQQSLPVLVASAGAQTITMLGQSSNITLDAQALAPTESPATYGGPVKLASLGDQTITFAYGGGGLHNLTLRAGSGQSSGQQAIIGAQGKQVIDGMTAGGELDVWMYGGSPGVDQNSWYVTDADGHVICMDCSAGAEARIQSKSTLYNAATNAYAQTIKARNLYMKGGSTSNGNNANIESDGGTLIELSGDLTMVGGDSGGMYAETYYGGHFVGQTWVTDSFVGNPTGFEGTVGNEASISAEKKVKIVANNVSLDGGGDSSGSFAGAYIGSPDVDIRAYGGVTLTAGGFDGGEGAYEYPVDPDNPVPGNFRMHNSVGIGWDKTPVGGSAKVRIVADDDVTMNGVNGGIGYDGSVYGGSIAFIGGLQGATSDVHIEVQNGSFLMQGDAFENLVGSTTGNATIYIQSDGGEGGQINLGSGALLAGTGAVELRSESDGGIISQAFDGRIVAGTLRSVASHDQSLIGYNRVATITEMTSATGSITYANEGDLTLSGNVTAYGGVTIVTSRDLTVAGTVDSEAGFVDLTAGYYYVDADWEPSETGGNLWLKSTSAIHAGGGYLWISAIGVEGERAGWVRQDVGGTISQTSGDDVDIQSWDQLTVNSVTAAGSSVTLKAGYSFTADGGEGAYNSAAKDMFLGHVSAAGGTVDAVATGAIYDNNGTGVANITADSVSLTSYHGGQSGGLAISADVAATSSIVANVQSGAEYGGIRIRSLGAFPSSVELTDNASYGARINFLQLGDISSGANIYVETDGDVSLSAERDFFNPGAVALEVSPNALMLAAGRDLNFNGSSLHQNGTDLQLVAGGTLTVSGERMVQGNNVTIVAGTLNLASEGGITADGDMSLVAGTVSLSSNGYLSAGGDFGGLVFGNVTLNNNSYIETETGALNLTVGGSLGVGNGSYLYAGWDAAQHLTLTVNNDIALHNDAQLKAGDDVKIKLLGANSTLYINELPGYDPSKIISDIYTGVPATTHVEFTTRTSGGIVIDGLATMDTLGGGSGFYVGNDTTVARPGFGLDVQHSAPRNNDLITSILDRVTDSDSLDNTPADDGTGKPPKKRNKDDKDDPDSGDQNKQKNAQKPVGRCT